MILANDPQMKKIVLIASNFGQNFGGEAIKAWQYAKFLKKAGYQLLIISHERCRDEIAAEFQSDDYRLIFDDWITMVLWKTPLRIFMSFYFHWLVRNVIRRENLDPDGHILHYIAPISPVAVRLPPKGFQVVMGPLSGNIYYPPAFKGRMSFKDRLREQLHKSSQWLMGKVFGDKRRANTILNSGYERTRESLLIAGCRDDQFLDVVDSGVSENIASTVRFRHADDNFRFVCIGRLVDVKAFDLAIRAVAKVDPRITLDIYGVGNQREMLEQLSVELGLEGRVKFCGWLEHDKLVETCRNYRGFVFPSLADSNGIVVQEAMMLGLPAVMLRWGGPAMLADDESAIYIDPNSEEHVIAEMARGMERLATDGEFAENLAVRARNIAEARFTWDAVAASWENSYR